MLNKFSVYLLGSLSLFFLGVSSFLVGSFFLVWDYVIFMDWEILSMNGCSITMTFLFDWISLVFVGCVFVISSMVIYYSESYMGSDVDRVRFYFLVFLFVMSMMMMIVSPNLMSILIGWDGLGLVSYCLVIYFQNYKSYSAGMLTILTNRVGDVAILLSIAWMLNFGSWHYIFYMGMWDYWEFYLISLIVLAGFTSSAQIPFSSWLPAAMAAPTPVSSLVHSSTLVTAGVYLLIRFSEMLSNFNCSFILALSMMTMFMAGLGANLEFDLSSIIALSTLSQLGLMMSILFLGYPILSFLHLLTHAFFKALLFLCAGVMIHCMNDSQDIRYMGAMTSYLPFTCTCFCISNMSLCGLPFMSGFYSKDLILEAMTGSGYNFFVFLIFFVSIGLTVSYTFRVIYYVMFYNVNMHVCHGYGEDKIMMKSMIVLALLAISGGSMLSWLIFSVPELFVLPLHLKLMPLVFIFLGGWLGYEFSSVNLGEFPLSLRFYFISFFSGSMWFMPYFSTFMLYGKSFYLSKMYYEVMDGGWGEYVVSSSPLLFTSSLSKLMNYYQFNNVKIYMMVFVLIFIFSLI
uniref:NADH-ubiquinone oxidoreductase chain 5 n=2 Tax=Triatoma infestans TaxID=30076 RepID=T1WDS2_TRIIF|nr:NADH dehydrogenase subunit 5 [Triatoma infestans]AGU12381.1 NADH dehydrogenase subunit 5 [Triatoma infestans]AGU12385.1 NADH dehydrogenase subunit 5 [Triatoma infestans]AGU12395.1 NADH dehydrogenase subunit 5 [Triatoma infestans]AGU12397.1 NADH dehydrogenase subunit 5 [Triatoma infestans]